MPRFVAAANPGIAGRGTTTPRFVAAAQPPSNDLATLAEATGAARTARDLIPFGQLGARELGADPATLAPLSGLAALLGIGSGAGQAFLAANNPSASDVSKTIGTLGGATSAGLGTARLFTPSVFESGGPLAAGTLAGDLLPFLGPALGFAGNAAAGNGPGMAASGLTAAGTAAGLGAGLGGLAASGVGAAAALPLVIGSIFGPLGDRESIGAIRERLARKASDDQQQQFAAQAQNVVNRTFPDIRSLDQLAATLNAMQGRTLGIMGDHPITFDAPGAAVGRTQWTPDALSTLAGDTSRPLSLREPQVNTASGGEGGTFAVALRQKLFDLLPLQSAPAEWNIRPPGDYAGIAQDIAKAWTTAGGNPFPDVTATPNLARLMDEISAGQGGSLTPAQKDFLAPSVAKATSPQAAFSTLYEPITDYFLRRPSGNQTINPGDPLYIPAATDTQPGPNPWLLSSGAQAATWPANQAAAWARDLQTQGAAG